MDKNEENKIVGDHAEAVMKELSAGGKPVEAVVTVVFFKEAGSWHVGSVIDTRPESEEEANRQEGSVLAEASELLDDYLHQRGLCEACNEKGGNVH